MDIVTVSTIGTHEVTRQWPIDIYRDTLIATLQEAVERAAQRQRSILASFTLPMAVCDPICAFRSARQAQLGECFFWEHPIEQQALVGVGAAMTIETQGNTFFTDAASAWREVIQDAVVRYGWTGQQRDRQREDGRPWWSPLLYDATGEIVYSRGDPGGRPSSSNPANSGPVHHANGPVFFGGFAFDPLVPRSLLWEGFPDGLLILPSLLLSYNANHVTLTVNRMIGVEDNIAQCSDEMIAGINRLDCALGGTQFIAAAWLSAPSEGVLNCVPTIRDLPSASEWKALVAETVKHIQQGAYEKVVLARSVQVTLDAPTDTLDIDATLQQLRQSYPDTYVFAIQCGERFFVGATPERLIQAEDGQIRTMALAGSAPRGATEEEDTQIGMELLQSEKNNAEHALVVTLVRDALLTHCSHVHLAEKPQLLKLKNVQHLKTPIAGELLPGRCILDVMAHLHPTPAVGGFPRNIALTTIRKSERLDRGWYAGPLGWIGASGHGEFAVALRSGLIDGNKATLFAGCGIVANSDPEGEYIESCLKLQVMLRGLQVLHHNL